MKAAAWSRKLHKWLALAVGIQAFLWMASGLYMTAISIDVIHGDHLAHMDKAPLSLPPRLADPDILTAQYPGLTRVRLRQAISGPVYEVQHPGGSATLDAVTGAPLAPLARERIDTLARSAYQGDGTLTSLQLLAVTPPELRGRPAPLWRADFDDLAGTSLYFSSMTGDLLGKRHDLWRAFDFLWMLHIMDYESREDVNNLLLRVVSVLGVLFAVSGAWLLVFTLRVRRVP